MLCVWKSDVHFPLSPHLYYDFRVSFSVRRNKLWKAPSSETDMQRTIREWQVLAKSKGFHPTTCDWIVGSFCEIIFYVMLFSLFPVAEYGQGFARPAYSMKIKQRLLFSSFARILQLIFGQRHKKQRLFVCLLLIFVCFMRTVLTNKCRTYL